MEEKITLIQLILDNFNLSLITGGWQLKISWFLTFIMCFGLYLYTLLKYKRKVKNAKNI
jgi:hypothetical protein